MRFAEQNRGYLIKAYAEGKSSYQMAEELGTYSNKILRALTFLKVERRSYDEAQKMALKNGRSSHPTQGKTMSEEARLNMSNGIAKVWAEMPEEERDRRSEMSKAQWAALSEADKAYMCGLAAEAVRSASKDGSKAEKFVRKELTKAGWTVQFHVKNLIPDANLEVDLFVPGLKTAIEIDGPAHFLPIWGEDKLAKHQIADARKSGLLMSKGYCLIRVKQITKSLSMKKQRDMLNAIVAELEKIADAFPKDGKRLIEIEV